MHEKENAEKKRRPAHVEQHRAGTGLGELPQRGEIAIGFGRARGVGAISVFEAGGEYRRTQPLFKPNADSAQGRPAQCVQQAADHDGGRDDQRQHQERVGAAARQDAIIDLKQVDRRRQQQEIVAAAVREYERERAGRGAQRRLQRRVRRRQHVQQERRRRHCGPPLKNPAKRGRGRERSAGGLRRRSPTMPS